MSEAALPPEHFEHSDRETLHAIAAAASRSSHAAEKSASVAEKAVHALELTVKMHKQNVRRLRLIRDEAKHGHDTTVKSLEAVIVAGFSASDRAWKRTVIVLTLGLMLSNILSPTIGEQLPKLIHLLVGR